MVMQWTNTPIYMDGMCYFYFIWFLLFSNIYNNYRQGPFIKHLLANLDLEDDGELIHEEEKQKRIVEDVNDILYRFGPEYASNAHFFYQVLMLGIESEDYT